MSYAPNAYLAPAILMHVVERERTLRVMQSFGKPRATTNPYIHMLDTALGTTPGLEHVRFGRRAALFGRYDVLHFHWPETLLGGTTPVRKLARRLLFEALLLRLRLTGTGVVRTMHNIDLPTGISRWDRRLLEAVDRRTDFRILLNDQTPVAAGRAYAVIPHGDFRHWFREHEAPEPAPTPGLISFVGLIRRYKGIEQLIAAFREVKATDARLRICGNPTSEELADEIRALAGADPRIEVDLRFLNEREFAAAVRAAEGVVLPYRFMHNSGSVLAALSLERPVLVPRNEVNERLAQEVGPGWVMMFDGELTADELTSFLPEVRAERATPAPDLSARSWESVGVQHRDAYRAALASRRGARSGSRS